MADSYTTTASLDLDQATWDLALYYALRPNLYFDSFADVKSVNAAPSRGVSVAFTIMNDLAVASTALNESVDVNAVAPTDSQVTLTLAEYGNAIIDTFAVRATSFIPLDPAVVNLVGFNAGQSQDTIARDVMKGGTNVIYSGSATSRNTVVPTATLAAADVRKAYAYLAAANVVPFTGGDPAMGGMYAAVIHPHTHLDLRKETGSGAWRTPREYADPSAIYTGEVGTFEGFRFVVSPRAPLFADAGSSTTLTDVYRSLFFGRQAMAKAFSTYEGRGPVPITIFGPVTDKLKRFQPVGWHWFGTYGIFRQASLYAVESASSIGTNA